ncbi:MAG: CPBP family intramembrane glutamic endopeptidase [Pseudomonadota bacterium]
MSVWSFDYAAHDVLVAPARARPELWRLFFGIVLIAGMYLAFNQMFFDLLLSLFREDNRNALITEIQSGNSPRGMLVLLYQFGFLALATGITCLMLNRRDPIMILGPWRNLRYQFIVVLVGLFALSVALWALPPYTMGAAFEPGLAPQIWVMLLPLSLSAVLVQTATEEYLFRGYIQQQLAARFSSPWMWMVVPSALFGLGHYLPNTAGENALTIALWACFFGILMADITARAGSLGPAIAIHFANNASAMLLVGLPDDMSGLALYHTPFGMADEEALAAWLPVDFGLMLVSWLTARVAIRR